MAGDAVSIQILHDEGNSARILLQSTSDGTGESAVLKVDVSALQGSPAAVAIKKIVGNAVGMSAKLLWDASTDSIAYQIPDANTGGPVDDCFEPPIRNPAATGATGDILLTTVGHTAGDTYTILLDLIKVPLT